MHRSIWLALPISTMAALLASRALATPDFPGVIQQVTGAPGAPDCTICHASDAGGLGTVTRPFGELMLSRGVRAFDEDSLRNALAAIRAEMTDTNHDGVTDYDELAMGLDPNPAGDQDLPRYGCGARIAPARESSSAGGAILAGLVVLFGGYRGWRGRRGGGRG